MDFEKICMMFSIQEPFYGILLSSMRKIPDTKIPTMGVSKSGNVFQFRYNPNFLEKFNNDTILQLLRHEVLHVAFNHFAIWDTETDSPEIHRLRNISADLEVNGYLDRNKIQKEAGGLFAPDFGLENFLGTREYFKILFQMENNRKQQAQGNPDKPCNGGKTDQKQDNPQTDNQQQQQDTSKENQENDGDAQSDVVNDPMSPEYLEQATNALNDWANQRQQNKKDKLESAYDNSKPFDDHSEWPEEEPDSAEAQQMQQMIDDMLDFAAQECEKNHGSIPAEMKFRIENIRKRPKPVADWKRFFRRYLGNEFSELIRKSKKRESRRFPDAAGNRHRRKSHILVAIDTSGSVSMPEYQEFMGQLRTLQKDATFHVVECDACIQYEYDYTGRTPEILHGGGGTDFQPPVDLFNKNKRLYDALVYFTDGYCPIPKDTPKDTLWVISSNGDKSDRNKYRKNGASVVFIPPKQ